MSWLNKLTKGVEEGVNRATSEADKAIRLTKVNNEIGGKTGEMERAFAALGQAVFALHQGGETLHESLTVHVQTLDALQQQLRELEAQREAIKAGAGEGAPSGAPAPAPAETMATPAFCSACGAPLPPGSAHCPRCGHQVGA